MNTTRIEWAEATWNPLTGCSPVSRACDHCYAERMARRLAGRWGYPRAPNHFCPTYQPDRLLDPLRWRKPRRIFIGSMTDLFHVDHKPRQLDRIFAVMLLAPRHRFLLLTKRPSMAWVYLTAPDIAQRVYCAAAEIAGEFYTGPPQKSQFWPLPHVGLGITAENQAMADERIPWLRKSPAALRFVSAEPLLGPLDLTAHLCPLDSHTIARIDPYNPGAPGRPNHRPYLLPGGIDWIIAGGETGPGARPTHPDWFRALHNQAVTRAIPFLFKRWGEWVPQPYRDWTRREYRLLYPPEAPLIASDDARPDHLPTAMFRQGRQARRCGEDRMLYGLRYDQFPEGF